MSLTATPKPKRIRRTYPETPEERFQHRSKAGKANMAKRPPELRSKMAREAVTIRWEKWRAAREAETLKSSTATRRVSGNRDNISGGS